MAFKSEAHRQKMQSLVRSGDITQAQYDQHDGETGSRKLPERVPSGPRLSVSETGGKVRPHSGHLN